MDKNKKKKKRYKGRKSGHSPNVKEYLDETMGEFKKNVQSRKKRQKAHIVCRKEGGQWIKGKCISKSSK
tara:strand:- start:890 stop:1096 length:207 start_codon:yes stop_codon:yes gene_type:complete